LIDAMNIITLLRDFGLQDPYVGIMKGVILSITPQVLIVDITHEIGPQDIMGAAFTIETYYPYFPKGTIHVTVVDPTVGSERLPIIVCKNGHILVGPDNGIFTLLLKGERVVYKIENTHFMLKHIGHTFHGRDIFSPVASYLASGVPPSHFGPSLEHPVMIPDIYPTVLNGILTGKIIRIDRYGNAISNIQYNDFKAFVHDSSFVIKVGDMAFTSLSKSYYESEFTCLVGSSKYLEFGHYMGSFSEKKGINKGDKITVELS